MESLWFLGVPLIGAGVGATELIARYKDAPFVAIKTGPAVWYILVNALVSFFAYVLIVNFGFKFGAEKNVSLVQGLVASFGAMAFFRSSLFSMKVGETDVAVGPAIFFQILLFATDRACDRERAQPRSTEVDVIMQGVSFDLARDALPSFCFELLQNVPASEQQQFRLVVDALASSTKMRDSIKVLNLGLMLLNIVGSKVLNAAVRTLGVKIQGPAKLELDVFTLLQKADFAKAYPLLVDVAFIMSKFGSADEQAKSKQAIRNEIDPLAKQIALDNSSKMTQLGLSLQQRVGDSVLVTALRYLDGSIGIGAAATSQASGAAASASSSGTQQLPAGSNGTGNASTAAAIEVPVVVTPAVVGNATTPATQTPASAGGLNQDNAQTSGTDTAADQAADSNTAGDGGQAPPAGQVGGGPISLNAHGDSEQPPKPN